MRGTGSESLTEPRGTSLRPHRALPHACKNNVTKQPRHIRVGAVLRNRAEMLRRGGMSVAARRGELAALLLVLEERVPPPAEVVRDVQRKDEQVVRYHARPRADEPEAEYLRRDKRAEYAYAPHARDTAHERYHRLPDALEHTFDDDGHAVERLAHRDHPQYRRAERDDCRVVGEDIHHVRREDEEERPGDYHQRDLYEYYQPREVLEALLVLCADGVAGERRRRRLHTEAGNVERALDGVRYSVRRGADAAERVYH